jgi:hypothetical protein
MGVESVNRRPLCQKIHPLPNALIADYSLESAPFGLFPFASYVKSFLQVVQAL